jgi:hypothetical protein
VVGDRIGVALLFIVVVGVHRGNCVVAEVGTEILDMADDRLLHEAESGARVVIQNSREMRSQHQPSPAKKMQGECQELGELTGTGIPEGHPGEDVFQCCSPTYVCSRMYCLPIYRILFIFGLQI